MPQITGPRPVDSFPLVKSPTDWGISHGSTSNPNIIPLS